MTSETYYPEQRHLLPITLVRRERLLPTDVAGRVEVRANTRVDLREVVARGTNPAPYVLLDVIRFFRLRQNANIEPLLQVGVDDLVDEGQVIASRGRAKLVSPIVGTVKYIGQGQVIIQEMPTTLELEAGLNGQVVEVRKNRGVVIETYGALLQGVWGNNRRAIGPLRIEPGAGLESILFDSIDLQYRGAIMVTKRPMSTPTLQIIEDQQFAGVIAPSIEPDMIERAMEASCAILLTEGFGALRMSTANAQFLDGLGGRQATIDAVLPTPLEVRRPEVIVNVPLEGVRPMVPNINLALQVGMVVRLIRGATPGVSATIIDLPERPVLLDNGLRVPCAGVELNTGEKLFVPLANIEVTG